MAYDFSHALAKIPGLCGDIARYLDSKLDTPQPGIALATAIAFVGALKSGRISYKGIHPSIYTVAVASPGSGKTVVQDEVSLMCSLAGIKEDLLMGSLVSEAGMINRLAEHPRQFLIWDEFGHELSALSKSKNHYQASILSTIMKLFSASGKLYLGKQYADKTRKDVVAPFLSMAAASTPNRFYEALDSDTINDGFLSRFLVFDCPNSLEFRDKSLADIPPHIISDIKIIQKWKHQEGPGNLQVAKLDCVELKFDREDATSMIKQIYERSKDLIIEASKRSDFERCFWIRSYEIAVKLCIIFADESGVCSESSVVTAWQLVEYCNTQLRAKCEELVLGDSFEKQKAHRMKRFIDILRPGEKLTAKQVTNISIKRGFNKNEKDQMLETLLEDGIWKKDKEKLGTSHKETTFYFCPI